MPYMNIQFFIFETSTSVTIGGHSVSLAYISHMPFTFHDLMHIMTNFAVDKNITLTASRFSLAIH